MDYQAVIPEFVVSDIEKSRHFYCDLLGYNVTPVVANSYYFDTLIEIEKATV